MQVVSEILSMLQGNSQLDPSVFGMTAAEEHTYLNHSPWPGIAGPVHPPNANLKLFGGAAFERCLQEFQAAAGQLDVPRVARDKVANVLLAHRGVSSGSMCDQVAQQIACGMANAMLLPLLDAASKRLAGMLRRVFDIGKLAMDSRSGGPGDLLRMYVSFHASLQVLLLHSTLPLSYPFQIAMMEITSKFIPSHELILILMRCVIRPGVCSLSSAWLLSESHGVSITV
jgi:hypothetical protein